ncbi:MAG TPA: response regulator transcription factor [Verrucomicrobiae bacterium]|nr:response regulator transcription factor [Verrucomicrobiae bacterium]
MVETTPLIKVAIVEDKREERESLTNLLRKSDGIEWVGACGTVQEALQVLPKRKPNIVLMDIHLAGQSGIDCVRQLRPLMQDTQFMMLTVVEDHDKIFDSLSAGATGYLLKSTSAPKLLEAIEELHRGGSPMSGQIAREVIRFFQTKSPAPGTEDLTNTEQRVLELLARGLLYKDVADRLETSLSTVRTHIWHIYRKLEVHNRTDAIRKGLRR